MKRIFVLGLALVAVFAVGSVAALAGKGQTKKVDTSVTIKFKAGDAYYEQGDQFSGKVSAKKKCKQDRKVVIKAKNDGKVGTTFSAKNGKYFLDVDNVDPGKYYAKVKKRTYKKGKKHHKKTIVCKSAKSAFVNAT